MTSSEQRFEEMQLDLIVNSTYCDDGNVAMKMDTEGINIIVKLWIHSLYWEDQDIAKESKNTKKETWRSEG